MIADNLKKIKASIPEEVELVAVSKTKPAEDIMEAYNAGHRVFGENKIQEMASKHELLPKDIKWHMIGHVQSNKVKYMAPFVDLIHGVESFKLLQEINKRAKQNNRIIKCLLQVYIAQEDTKFGLSYDEVEELLNMDEYKKMENIEIAGLMAMASNTDDEGQIASEFSALNEFYKKLKEKHPKFRILSMGMSGDYKIAIENGSNMIRVGSSIFGARNYNK